MNQKIKDALNDPSFMDSVVKSYVERKKTDRATAQATYADPRWSLLMNYFVNNPNTLLDEESLRYANTLADLRRQLPNVELAVPNVDLPYLCNVFKTFNELLNEEGSPFQQIELDSGEYVTIFDNKVHVRTIIGQGSLSFLSAFTPEIAKDIQAERDVIDDHIHEVKMDPRWQQVVTHLRDHPSVELQHAALTTLETPHGAISIEFLELVFGARVAIERQHPELVKTYRKGCQQFHVFDDNLVLVTEDAWFSTQYSLRYATKEEQAM